MRKLLLICLLILPQGVVLAQQLKFQNYSTADGLGGNTVNCIFQDSRGFIWFGLQAGGITRFNGTEFLNLTEEHGLIHNDVTCITEDAAGNLWVGTTLGISKYDGKGFTNFGESSGLIVRKGVYSLYAHPDGSLWVGTLAGGINVLQNGRFITYNDECGMPSNSVFAIVPDNGGNLWLACTKGAAVYDGNSFRQMPELAGRNFFSAMRDSKGRIWLGGRNGGGFALIDQGRVTDIPLPELQANDLIGALAEGINGNVWLATGHGALRFNGSAFSQYGRNNGLAVNEVNTVARDREGNIWFGTQGGGTFMLGGEAFTAYTREDGLDIGINCLAYDPVRKTLLAGTPRAGLWAREHSGNLPTRWSSGSDLVDGANYHALCFARDGRIIAGTDEGMLILTISDNRIHRVKHVTEIDGVTLRAVTALVEQPDGTLWAAAWGIGLLRMNPTDTLLFSIETGYPSGKVLALADDGDLGVWAATADNGAVRLRPDESKEVTVLPASEGQWVWDVSPGPQGSIILATDRNGILIHRQQGDQWLNRSNGLGADKVKGLAYDSVSSSLWAVTPQGINRINLAMDGNGAIAVRTFTERDGLLSADIDQNALTLTETGELWFGTPKGLGRFDPTLDRPPPVTANVTLENIFVRNDTVRDWSAFSDSVSAFSGMPQSLRLRYGQGHLTFRTRVLTTEPVRYAFFMEGMDDDWSPFSEVPEVRYTNMPAGEYVFRARAVNGNGLLSKEDLVLPITVLPPFYVTWWFITLCTGAVVITLVSVVKMRERALRQHNMELEALVAQRTEEVVSEKKEVERQFQRSESLLLNILPKETAEELKATGGSESRRHDPVTIIFTDFKGFTQLSEVLSPIDLVRDLHECFSAFDRICQKHRIEKIKTIGDAYMAAAGLPTPSATHAIDAVNAALEMRDFVREGKARKTVRGLPFFEIRIGIHTGPVVAGIVGINKFQYDIWGDTVNTASRMESSGEPDRINISETTRMLVEEHFHCIPRGLVQAKGKGQMPMYFLEPLLQASPRP